MAPEPPTASQRTSHDHLPPRLPERRSPDHRRRPDPAEILRAAPGGRYYPPALTGLRGSHPGAFEVAHQMGWEKKTFDVDHLPIEEEYDLVVVGGGISASPPPGSIANGTPRRASWSSRTTTTSAAMPSATNSRPAGALSRLRRQRVAAIAERPYSEDAKHLLKRLGVELKRFETAFDTDFYPGLGLSRAVFFDKASFGVDKLVSGDPTPMVADEVPAIVSMPAPGAPSSATSR